MNTLDDGSPKERTAEGVIGLIVERSAGATVIDFKTDSVGGNIQKFLETFYAAQRQKYLHVANPLGLVGVKGICYHDDQEACRPQRWSHFACCSSSHRRGARRALPWGAPPNPRRRFRESD